MTCACSIHTPGHLNRVYKSRNAHKAENVYLGISGNHWRKIRDQKNVESVVLMKLGIGIYQETNVTPLITRSEQAAV